MATTASDYLPAPFADADILSLLRSLSIGIPTSIKPLKVTAAFHIIYVLTFEVQIIRERLPAVAAGVADIGGTVDLILRISGDHIPSIKTENEAAVISWVQRHTKIPVPIIVSHDATTSNVLRREYILFTRCPGVPISDVYDTLGPSQLDSILHQIIDILIELESHPFGSIGGLAFAQQSDGIISGPIIDETFWFLPDVEKYFPGETLETVNVGGPFDSYISFTAAALRSHMHVIRVHPSLAYLRPYLPRFEAFIAILPKHASVLNNTPIRLAHKDLHFANILYSQETGSITAVLDWEFAGTVPGPRWDPARAFLWNGKPGDEALKEKYRLRDRYKELCEERKVQYLLKNAEFTSELQEAMHTAMNMLRGIVTTVPRGEALDLVDGWRKDIDKALEAFGV